MRSTTVIVPSWGRLAPDMEAETGCQYAAFIPLGGMPLYRHLVSQYQSRRTHVRFVFVLAAQAPAIERELLEGFDVHVVRLAASRSIGETVLAGLADLPAGDAVVVHMADTLLDLGGAPEGDAVFVQSRADLYRWTSVVADQGGRITVLSDREQVGPSEAQSVCVGLFSFDDGEQWNAALRESVDCPDPSRSEPFFAALEVYSQRRPITLRPIERWFDCGHVDTYYESRLGYQNLRHFNTLSYDPSRGQVTKTSLALEAFRHQVRWFKQVPDDLAAYLPRIFDSSDGSEPFITMELLSIPTLSDLFISRRLSLGAWNGVVRTIAHIQSRFALMVTRSSLAPQLARSVYLDKTQSRLVQFTSQQPEATKQWIVYGDEHWSLERVQETLHLYVERTGLLDLEELTPIHGDFCFSNLLYDTKVRLVKMIDPRGEFGVPGIFGDPRYDLAKLAHSYGGGYDFIVTDRFGLEQAPNGELRTSIHIGDYQHKVRSIFEAVLLPSPALRRQVDALQALLFLSMLPLHVDKPRRQLAMLATGLELYARSWQQERIA